MRLTDDYLFVTTDLHKANRVIDALLRCAKDNHFEINEEKVKTNFPFSMKNGVINPVSQTQISTGSLQLFTDINIIKLFLNGVERSLIRKTLRSSLALRLKKQVYFL